MTNTAAIPFLDLVGPHLELQQELLDVFGKTQRSAAFIGGPMVEEFERDFADFCEVSHCAGVGSGTDALRLMLIAAGIGEGDVVVTVPNTFIATTEAISQAGARPDFVDVDGETFNMDPAKLQEYFQDKCYVDGRDGHLMHRRLGKRVKAVIPVHLYGQMADMDAILDLAERFDVQVFEDACQAHGAQYFSERQGRWMRAGSMGRAAAFSFYPGKNLGACGEAGAVTTNDSRLAQKIRVLRDHGQAKKYYHDVEGYNGRLDALQAGILQIKLRRLAGWNEQRRVAAQRYAELLAPAGDALRLPYEPDWTKSVYHLYVVGVEGRDNLQKHLAEANIGTGIHYPVPLHLQKAYKWLGYKDGEFPVCERSCNRILSLPMHPSLKAKDQVTVARETLAFASRKPRTLTAGAYGD